MFKRKMPKEKSVKIFELKKQCFDNLETAGALIQLVQQSFLNNKSTEITLNAAMLNIKKSIELILNIQDEV